MFSSLSGFQSEIQIGLWTRLDCHLQTRGDVLFERIESRTEVKGRTMSLDCNRI